MILMTRVGVMLPSVDVTLVRDLVARGFGPHLVGRTLVITGWREGKMARNSKVGHEHQCAPYDRAHRITVLATGKAVLHFPLMPFALFKGFSLLNNAHFTPVWDDLLSHLVHVFTETLTGMSQRPI